MLVDLGRVWDSGMVCRYHMYKSSSCLAAQSVPFQHKTVAGLSPFHLERRSTAGKALCLVPFRLYVELSHYGENGWEHQRFQVSMAMGETFLTEPLAMDLPEPEVMTRVREEHSRLQGVVFSLNKKISQVLAKQEGDFLAAYRAHMYTVQKELQTLRQRVIEAENVLQVTLSC